MTDRPTELRKRLAAALFDKKCGHNPMQNASYAYPFAKQPPAIQAAFFESVDAILAEITAAGWQVVPVDATDAWLNRAGAGGA